MKRGESTYLRPLENEDMSLALFPSTFPELFLLNPRSSQRKSKSHREMDGTRPLGMICRTRKVTGKQVVYTIVLGNGVGSCHSDAPFQMSSHKPHRISTLNGQVVVCGLLLSSQISYMSYPTPNLGGNLDYDQEEGNSSNLSPNIITLLPVYNQCQMLKRYAPLSGALWVSLGRKSHTLRFVPGSDSDAIANCSQFDSVLIFEKACEFICECMCVGVHKLVDWLMYILHCLNLV